MHWRLSDFVDRLASERRTGLVFIDEYGHRRDYTFAEIAAHSQRYAAVLRAFGIQQNERVYVRLSTTAKATFALLALERLGASAILAQAEAAGASTVISNREYRVRVDLQRGRFAADARYVIIGEEHEGWARLDTLAHIASPIARANADVDEEALREACTDARERLCSMQSDVVWCALQIEDEGWFERAIAQPWLAGAAAVLHNGAFEPSERLDLLRELDVAIVLQRAQDYRAELSLPDPKRFKMPRLRRCLVLDDDCDEALQAQWAEHFGIPLTADRARV